MIKLTEGLIALSSVAPCEIFAVGGFVRNSILNLPPSDVDLAGALKHDRLCLPPPFKVVPVNAKLGTAVIAYKDERYEYTPFRTENYAKGGTHSPDSVCFTEDIYADSLRRDFTMGAVYYSLKSGTLTDFHGGEKDIKNRIVKAVDDPVRVFSSDGLRLLRLVRQTAELGFEIDDATFSTAKAKVFLLADISKERIRDELDKILVADLKYGIEGAHYRGLKLLGELGAWKYVLPEVEDGIGVVQNPLYHSYDVYEHILHCVLNAPPKIRLAALLHDIGKPESDRRIGKMYLHAELGEAIARRALGQSGLKYPNEIVNRTARLIKHHMYNKDGTTRKGKLRRFVADNRDILDDLVSLIKADSKAKGMENQADFSNTFIETRTEMQELGLPFCIKELDVNGNDLAAAGIEGASIGETLDFLLSECLREQVCNQKSHLLAHAVKCPR